MTQWLTLAALGDSFFQISGDDWNAKIRPGLL